MLIRGCSFTSRPGIYVPKAQSPVVFSLVNLKFWYNLQLQMVKKQLKHLSPHDHAVDVVQ